MADGGGLQPIQLSADLVARAVIAAARSYGDDPVKACTCAPNASARRSLTAAASGLNRGGVAFDQLERMLGVRRSSVFCNRSRKPAGFAEAALAALRAVEYVAWRPEAAETLVVGAQPEVIAGAADGELGDDPVVHDLVGDEPLAEPELPAPPSASEPEAIPEPIARPLRIPAAFDEPMVEPPAPPPRPQAGPIASMIMPSVARRDVPLPKSDRPITDLVLEALAAGALNTMSLAFLIDRKEMAVTSAVSQLQHEGRVRSAPVENGPRRFVWMLVEGDLA